VANAGGEQVFVLRFLQGRDPDWVHRPFLAKYDPQAYWLDDLEPALGEKEFFFEPRLREILDRARGGATVEAEEGLVAAE
jgi:hypothetical protein